MKSEMDSCYNNLRGAGMTIFGTVLFVFFTSCHQLPPDEKAKLVSRGKAVYLANCVTCHAMDPSQEGPTGPPVAGSSRELLEGRLIHLTYPTGYTPKRSTNIMPPFPYLQNEIAALEAFLGLSKY